jgi:hypothetical protein
VLSYRKNVINLGKIREFAPCAALFPLSFPPFTGGSDRIPCSLYGFGQGALLSETRGIAGKHCPSKAVAWKGMQEYVWKGVRAAIEMKYTALPDVCRYLPAGVRFVKGKKKRPPKEGLSRMTF